MPSWEERIKGDRAMSRQERIATIVSLVPFPITEWKPGIYPGYFEIPAAKKDDFELFYVGDSCFWVEISEDRSIKVKCPADDVANSVVNDYLVSNLEYNVEKDSMPGVFWKLGRYTREEIKKEFILDLELARTRQNNWFLALIKLADDDWTKTHQHRSITDMQRYAAKSLNLDKDWLVAPKVEGSDFQRCIACTNLVPKEAIVCPQCRCILNKKKYDELKFAESIR